MRREHLEHILRAAGDCSGEREFIVVGSQAILGAAPDADPRLLGSSEVDLWPVSDRQEVRDVIDGTLGELTPFHEAHGYYAQGVASGTAFLPDGWRERACVIDNENTNGTRAICPDPADIVASKLARGDSKDVQFATAALQSGLVAGPVLRERVATLAAPPAVREHALRLAAGLITALERADDAHGDARTATGNPVQYVAPHLRGGRHVKGYPRRRRTP